MEKDQEIENEKGYEELLLGKTERFDPTKNPNYKRFTGLSNLIKRLKYDLDRIKNSHTITGNFDSHVLLFIQERVKGMKIVLGYYEEEIQSVKRKLELGIKNV